MSDYTWIVTQDKLFGDSSDVVGQIGPRGSNKRVRFDTVINRGAHVRLLTKDGAPRYVGYILGEFSGFELLDDYGRQNGCTDIEYERDRRWVAPAGAVPLIRTVEPIGWQPRNKVWGDAGGCH